MEMKKIYIIIIAIILCYSNNYAENHYVASVAKYTDSWISIDNTTVNIPSEGGEFFVKLQTNLDLKVTSRPSWITPSFDNKTTLKLVAKKYSGKNQRVGSLILKGKDMKSLTLTIVQFGSNSSLLTSKKELIFYGDVLSDSFTIAANIAYTVEYPEWLTKVSEEKNKFVFSTEKLYGEYSRVGNLLIKDSVGNVLKTIQVTQYYHNERLYHKPHFAVISDIHFGDTNAGYWYNRAPKYLKTLSSFDPPLQYLFIVGDIGDRAQSEQYQDVKSYFNNAKYLNQDIKKIFVRGNHDWMNGETGVSYFNQYISSTDNYYFTIEGYPCIALGLDGNLYRGETFNEETREFLKVSLNDASIKYPDKPIFVFTHTLPCHTIIGSYDNGDYAAYDDNIDNIFREYPQVINISGHTHMGIMDPHNIYQKYYTAVNDGSQKSDSHPTKFPGKNHYQASNEIDYYLTEGLVIGINEKDEVVIERWNTARGVKYDEDWIISPPFNSTKKFRYTENRNGGKNPWWEEGAELTVTQKSNTECFVEIPHAVDDNEGVNRYIISVTNESGSKVISDINQSALQYMCSERPAKITMLLQKLPTGIPLKITVTARDYYELSSPALTKTITLK